MPDVGECDQASLTALQRSEVRDRQLRDGEKSDRVILGLSNLLVKKKLLQAAVGNLFAYFISFLMLIVVYKTRGV